MDFAWQIRKPSSLTTVYQTEKTNTWVWTPQSACKYTDLNIDSQKGSLSCQREPEAGVHGPPRALAEADVVETLSHPTCLWILI